MVKCLSVVTTRYFPPNASTSQIRWIHAFIGETEDGGLRIHTKRNLVGDTSVETQGIVRGGEGDEDRSRGRGSSNTDDDVRDRLAGR